MAENPVTTVTMSSILDVTVVLGISLILKYNENILWNHKEQIGQLSRSVGQSVRLSVSQSVSLSVCLSVYMYEYMFAWIYKYMSIC